MKVICFGDSLTSCGGPGGRYSDILQDRFPTHTFINRGVGGNTFVDALARLDQDVLAEKPDVVVVAFGANDWWRNERPNTAWAEDLDTILGRIRGIGARAVVVGVFDLYRNQAGQMVPKVYGIDERAVAYRDMERTVAEKHGCAYIPNMQVNIIEDRTCWRDRNHPNEHGNRFVANEIEGALARLLGSEPCPVRNRRLNTTRDMWDEAVELAADSPAVIYEDQRLTFAEAEEKISRLAAGLLEAAGHEAPKVAVFLPNCLEYFLLYWAVVKIGGMIVPLNTWLKKDSLSAIFETVSPDILVFGGKTDREVHAALADFPRIAAFSLRDAEGPGCRPFDSLENCRDRIASSPLPEENISIIMHTSGTTAAPKGAVMRHCDLIFNVMTTINAQRFVPGDVHLLVNPMFHCTALYSSLPTAAYQKSPVIITADTTPDGLMALIARHRITTFLTVPSILQRIVALPNLADYDSSSLRVIGYAGSFMPVKTVRRLQELFPDVEQHNFFGLTETISATHVLNGEDAFDRPDSIGRLLPFVEARIIDENGNALPPGTVGELIFARENVIAGYYNRPGKLEEAFIEVEGRLWFNTGDLAMVDEEGFAFIKGRKKDMIIVGGENVFSAEVEAVLMSHGKVREAAVKGIPATGVRESLGEMIKAYVVAEDGAELTERDIRRHCHERLPSYKIPHIIEFLPALPRNPSGKVLKDSL